MPLKGANKRNYNKKYYADNKDKISEKKKVAYQEELDKNRADTAARSKTSYYKDLESSRADTAARKKATYDKA